MELQADLMGTKDAAVFLGITPDYLRTLCKTGKIVPHGVVAGWRVFARGQLEEWLAERAAKKSAK